MSNVKVGSEVVLVLRSRGFVIAHMYVLRLLYALRTPGHVLLSCSSTLRLLCTDTSDNDIGPTKASRDYCPMNAVSYRQVRNMSFSQTLTLALKAVVNTSETLQC